MKKHALCEPPFQHDEEDDLVVPEKKRPAAAASGFTGQLDVCRCPKCDGPMTARHGPRGPYFHCLCFEKARPCEALQMPAPAPPAASLPLTA